MKKCKICKLNKFEEEFSKCKTGRNGLNARCKECIRKYHEDYRSKESTKEYLKNWRKNNKELKAKLDKEYYNKNKEQILNYKKEWNKSNTSKNKKYYENRFKSNKGYYYAKNSERREKRRKTKLTNEEKEIMKLIYECAQWASLVVGESVEVDHKIPLSKGGKHHPDNLEIVTKKYNRQKSNKII